MAVVPVKAGKVSNGHRHVGAIMENQDPGESNDVVVAKLVADLNRLRDSLVEAAQILRDYQFLYDLEMRSLATQISNSVIEKSKHRAES